MVMLVVLYASLGALVGLLAGLLGIGGGIVIVPILLTTFTWQHFSPEIATHMALGTSMGSIVFTSIASAMSHNRHGGVDWRAVKGLTPGIIVGTFVGAGFAASVSSQWLQAMFGLFLLFVAYQIASEKKPAPTRHLPGIAGLSVVGGVLGLVSSLVGIGGGSMSVPYMLWNNMEARRALGTSAAIGFPIAVSGCLGYILNGWDAPELPEYSIGFLYMPALLGIVLVSMCTVPFGVKLAQHFSVGKLKKGFSVLLLAMSIKMLWGLF